MSHFESYVFTKIIWQTKGRFMSRRNICVVPPSSPSPTPPASPWMRPGTVSTNSNTAGPLREIHLPSLGMPKWLWRCNSLILGSEQCSSYCYGKSMWLSWRAASAGFSWGALEQSSNSGGQPLRNPGKKKKRQRAMLAEVKRYMKKKGRDST